MALTLKLHDLHRLQYENQFSLLPSDTLFTDPFKKFFITNINSIGSWSITYKTIKEETTYTRIGTGNYQLFHPLVTLDNFTTIGITQISGFWIPA